MFNDDNNQQKHEEIARKNSRIYINFLNRKPEYKVEFSCTFHYNSANVD